MPDRSVLEEIPGDESRPVPILSARAKRMAAMSVLLAVMIITLGSSTRQVGKALSLILSSTATSVSLSGIAALLVLLLTTFASILIALLLWRRLGRDGRKASVAAEIGEDVGVLFGFLVLSAWIPYLAFWPLALQKYLQGSGNLFVVSLETWVLYCAPFLVGLVSSRRTKRTIPVFIAAIVALLISAVLYVALIQEASPPLFSSQIETMMNQAEMFGPPEGETVIVMGQPFFRYPAGIPSFLMLVSLMVGLAAGYAFRLRGIRIQVSTRQIVLAVAVTVIVALGSWVLLIPHGGVEELRLSTIPVTDESSTILDSWVEPDELEPGENFTIDLEIGPSPRPFELHSKMLYACGGGSGGWRRFDERMLDKLDEPVISFNVQTSNRTRYGVDLSECKPMFLSYLTTEGSSAGKGMMRFYTKTFPNSSLQGQGLIVPCLYRSRLAFMIDPSLDPERTSIVYLTATRSGSITLRPIEPEGIYAFSDMSMIPKSMKSPQELAVWDSEATPLQYSSDDLAIFVAVVFTDHQIAVSSVFVAGYE